MLELVSGLLVLKTDKLFRHRNSTPIVAESQVSDVSILGLSPDIEFFLGCFGAVYWNDSFPWLVSWSNPKREASLALQWLNSGKIMKMKICIPCMWRPYSPKIPLKEVFLQCNYLIRQCVQNRSIKRMTYTIRQTSKTVIMFWQQQLQSRKKLCCLQCFQRWDRTYKARNILCFCVCGFKTRKILFCNCTDPMKYYHL